MAFFLGPAGMTNVVSVDSCLTLGSLTFDASTGRLVAVVRALLTIISVLSGLSRCLFFSNNNCSSQDETRP
jgi:hypothetical protein